MAGPQPRQSSDGRDRAQVLEELRKKLAPTAPKPKAAERPPLPTGWPELDQLLGGGLPRGAVVEATGTAGRMSLACAALAGATADGHLAALVDGAGALDPRALHDAGADLGQVLWCRPQEQTVATVLRLADILLDNDAFALVVLYAVGLEGRANSAAWLRLQQRAAQRGAAVLLLADRPLAGSFSAATVDLQRQRIIWQRAPGGRRVLLATEVQAQLGRARWQEGAGGSSRVRLDK